MSEAFEAHMMPVLAQPAQHISPPPGPSLQPRSFFLLLCVQTSWTAARWGRRCGWMFFARDRSARRSWCSWRSGSLSSQSSQPSVLRESSSSIWERGVACCVERESDVAAYFGQRMAAQQGTASGPLPTCTVGIALSAHGVCCPQVCSTDPSFLYNMKAHVCCTAAHVSSTGGATLGDPSVARPPALLGGQLSSGKRAYMALLGTTVTGS